MSQRSPTDLTETAWTVFTPLRPAAQPGGRPRTPAMREVGHAMFSLRRGGCQWRRLPKELPPHQTVSHACRPGRCGGVWEEA